MKFAYASLAVPALGLPQASLLPPLTTTEAKIVQDVADVVQVVEAVEKLENEPRMVTTTTTNNPTTIYNNERWWNEATKQWVYPMNQNYQYWDYQQPRPYQYVTTRPVTTRPITTYDVPVVTTVTEPPKKKPPVQQWYETWWPKETPTVTKPLEPMQVVPESPRFEYVPERQVYYEPVAPPPRRTQTEIDPLLMSFLLGNDNDDKMAMMLPLIMSRQSNHAHGHLGIHDHGPGRDLMSNPLFFMMMLDEADSKDDCAKKYGVTDAAKANPTIKEGDALMSEADFNLINYQYIGCMEFAAEGDDDSMMLPLLMQSMAPNHGGAPAVDPMMMLMLNGNHDSKSLLPFLMMSNGGTGQMDPLMMMMFMEDVACELKHHIPKKHYVRDTVNNKMSVVTDTTAVKTFFKALYGDYNTCTVSAGSDNSDDNMLFWLMMMGANTTA